MPRKTFVLCLGAMLLSVQLPALALSGCADSPENPTAVLALLAAAVGGTRYAMKKFGSRQKPASDASKAA